MTNILVIGDSFLPSQVFLNSLNVHLSGLKIKIEIVDALLVDGLGNSEDSSDIEARIIEKIGETEILVAHMVPIGPNVIQAAPKLRMIACARAGPVSVDIEFAQKHGVSVINAPLRGTEAVVDLTFGLMLSVARKIDRSATAFKKGVVMEYVECNGPELSGRTIGIIGFGSVGSRVACVAKAWGMNVLAYDPHLSTERMTALTNVVDLDTLLRQSDFVTIHARLSSDSYHMIGDRELSIMKTTAYLINTARGALVDERALYRALTTNRIAGAALDVLERDNDPNNPLIRLPNVTATPHIGGASIDVPRKAADAVSTDILRFLRGEEPLNAVRPEPFAFERNLIARKLLRD
jgi:phosphoglycerate dehydrogenase-like enzyme